MVEETRVPGKNHTKMESLENTDPLEVAGKFFFT
jgi:hypothetical protein